MIFVGHIKTHNTKSRCGNPSNTYLYETPEILRSFFSTDSCLESDNGVSTSNKAQRKIELYAVDSMAGHKLRPGRLNVHYFIHRMRLRGYSPESVLEYHADEVLQACHASAVA